MQLVHRNHCAPATAQVPDAHGSLLCALQGISIRARPFPVPAHDKRCSTDARRAQGMMPGQGAMTTWKRSAGTTL
ncbi:hypothetical protein APV28_2168 [Comamonas testosteroni]|nr:hypothetical protein APV28_2168 [Comamonas testosteroni]